MNKASGLLLARRFASGVMLSLTLAAAVQAAEQENWKLAMNDAELRDVVREMSSILGTTVVLDPRVKGKITVISDKELDREGVRRLFYSVLDAHNFTVIDEGDRILIAPVADARTRANEVDARVAQTGQFVTEVIGLNSTIASDLAALVRPLVSANGYVGPSSSSNALIITDSAANVRRIGRVVRELDSGEKSANTVVQLRHALASELAKIIEQSLGKDGIAAGGQVIADPRNNRLVIVGPQATRQRLAKLAASLDTASPAGSDNARVIRLRHSDAKQLAEVLDAVGQGGEGKDPAAKGAALAPSRAVVKADETQNALVLMAEPSQVRTLESIVEQLDQPRSQVLINAAIVEISGDITDTLGVQWGAEGGDASGWISFGAAGISFPGLTDLGENKKPDGGGLRLGGDRFGALITALASSTHNNILSTPSLLTLDNQEAEILVGQNVPFKSGSYQTPGSGSENPYTTVTRQDIGLKLKIKPYINDGSTLRLEVEQENSEISPSVEGLDDLITSKRALKSTILAEDGEVIVIGGLIKDNMRIEEHGVPLLKDIPWIGGLFSWNNEVKGKTNLVVFLRPTIVRSKQGISRISRDRYDTLRELSLPTERRERSLPLPIDPQRMFDGREPSSAQRVRQQ
jgi:general secretion pathway protein D